MKLISEREGSQNQPTIALSNSYFSYVMRVSPEGLLEHVYYGAPLRQPLDAATPVQRIHRGCTVDFEGRSRVNLNEIGLEYPTYGRSDYRRPAFHGRNADGNSVFDFRYKRHEVSNEKPAINGLPSSRGKDCETLKVILEDELYGIEAALYYTIYSKYGVLSRRTVISNIGQGAVDLSHIASTSISLPAGNYDAVHLHGTWAREFNKAREPLPTGIFKIDSKRGTSSAAHNPFLALANPSTTETCGDVYAAALVYSGNFAISAEKGEFGTTRLIAGINSFDFSWRLDPQCTFETPEALHVFSAKGLGEMSHIWHDFIRDKISPQNFKNKRRPTYVNTWEAAYFDIDEEKVLCLAETAASIGAQMLVLDDGWFSGRRDDTSSLGDWQADTQRFPNGIPSLAKQVKEKGLKFGIWVEPEMVSPNSALYDQHPEWAVQVPKRVGSTGRHQLTLDLSQQAVQEHLFDVLDTLLSCGDIDYVKWDMNRNMSEIGSTALPAHQQSEMPHRYMLGLYALLGRLTRKYPHILFENCASGGNRFDLGMLSFMAQGWVSDMCDPLGRLSIIDGASLVYPMDVLAAYIGPSPNHQNGRISSLESRYLAGAFCAAQGVSLNRDDISKHSVALSTYLKNMSSFETLGGKFDRLLHTGSTVIWQLTRRDSREIKILYFETQAMVNRPQTNLQLRGLDAAATYLTETGTYFGDELMNRGYLILPHGRGDMSGKIFTFMKDAT